MTQPAEQTTAIMKRMQEETVNAVLERVQLMQEANDIKLPDNYVPGNALKLAWLQLQGIEDRNKKPVLESCTKESICNALLEMVIKGMSVAKKQGYFIAYGNRLTFMPDYRGNLMIAKRDAGVKEVNAQVIYDGDKYVVKVNEFGVKNLVEHVTSLDNVDNNKIKGAYAVVVFGDGKTKLEEMTIHQIRTAWAQGAAGGSSGAHNKFTDQMCKKTVINRALKIEIGSSDDSELEETSPTILNEDTNEDKVVKARNEAVKEKHNPKPLPIQEVTYEDISEARSYDDATEPTKSNTEQVKMSF